VIQQCESKICVIAARFSSLFSRRLGTDGSSTGVSGDGFMKLCRYTQQLMIMMARFQDHTSRQLCMRGNFIFKCPRACSTIIRQVERFLSCRQVVVVPIRYHHMCAKGVCAHRLPRGDTVVANFATSHSGHWDCTLVDHGRSQGSLYLCR